MALLGNESGQKSSEVWNEACNQQQSIQEQSGDCDQEQKQHQKSNEAHQKSSN